MIRRDLLVGLMAAPLLPRPALADTAEARAVRAAFGGPYHAPALRDHVARIARRVADAETGGRLRVAVELLDSDQVNAAALPDGRLLVNRGLLALARSEAEVASVLAHEIGHVVAGHARSRAARPPVDPAVAGLAEVEAQAEFDRAQEQEADRIGIEALAQAGFDPAAAPAFLARLGAAQSLAASLSGRPELATASISGGDHPETAERLAAAQARAAALPPGETGEEAWLDAVDGLPWGEGAGQIPIRGQAVIDPAARFRWDAPRGVALLRQRQRVMGLGPDDSVILFDHLSQPRALPARLFLERVWGRRAGGVQSVGEGDLGGFAAAWGVAGIAVGPDRWEALLVVIETTPERRERFNVLTRAGSPATALARSAVESFRRIGAAEAAAVRPRRLVVVRVRPGDTVSSLVGRMRVEAAEARFRLLNDVVGDEVTPGARVKLIVE
ncbi:M48 family metalloprotease [Inquilinus sp. Marseille-Q2685]|uniref:M48 family metalloprotease n=1 Tax=Inquilinus sp. Marseille-Q2685 TaxID=2866581 RepID=UPI001CE3EC29|nr:M48 family metalloprotease [Inquilinus sp. Marseille-Q2685]